MSTVLFSYTDTNNFFELFYLNNEIYLLIISMNLNGFCDMTVAYGPFS